MGTASVRVGQFSVFECALRPVANGSAIALIVEVEG